MKRIIKPYNDNIPCIIPEGQQGCVIDIPRYHDASEERQVKLMEDQFKYSDIASSEYISTWGKGRSFVFGNYLVIKDRNILACICKNGNVLVNHHWKIYYPTEFNRFKKELKANGFNTRADKCIISVYDLHSVITEAPLKPTLFDYSEEAQLTISTEFLEQERNRINSNIELISESQEIEKDIIRKRPTPCFTENGDEEYEELAENFFETDF